MPLRCKLLLLLLLGGNPPPLTLVAEHSSTMSLGTAIAVAFPRSPMTLAMMSWDLARFSNGRFILGLGTQIKAHNERRFGIPWSAPAPDHRQCDRPNRLAVL